MSGVSVTEAAASDHHLVQSVVVFVLRVSFTFSTQQCVSEREEMSEVHPEVSHRDQL